jgi:glycosyltransferase involved in cell wall biosynthesis
MASATPIISSNVTSIPEIVGDAGILIEPTNLNQLEESIMKLLSDQSLRTDLISKGLKRVKDFSWESMAMKTLEIYNCANQSKIVSNG